MHTPLPRPLHRNHNPSCGASLPLHYDFKSHMHYIEQSLLTKIFVVVAINNNVSASHYVYTKARGAWWMRKEAMFWFCLNGENGRWGGGIRADTSCPVLFVLKIEERWQHGNGVAETAEGLRSRAREWLSMLVGGRSSKWRNTVAGSKMCCHGWLLFYLWLICDDVVAIFQMKHQRSDKVWTLTSVNKIRPIMI